MATLGSNQSERRKDNGLLYFGSRVSLALDPSSICSRNLKLANQEAGTDLPVWTPGPLQSS